MNFRFFSLLIVCGLALGGCALRDTDNDSLAYTSDRGLDNQPFPTTYRSDILAFLRTYLNNPSAIHNATIADPVQRQVGGRLRYVVCLKFSPRDDDGSYNLAKERAVVFIDGRLDRIIEQPSDICGGATYAQFPELEKLSR